MPNAHLAFDLGASSGRAIIGVLDGSPRKLEMVELHRFEHHPCPTPSGPVWNLTGIWLEIVAGLTAASQWCQDQDAKLVSVGVDAWGVDWTLVGESGELLGLPHCYRDPQNVAAAERILSAAGGKLELYQRTGIQHMPINTLFQYAARFQKEPGLFEAATRMLFVPDLFHFWLSGKMVNERTIASTSEMASIDSGKWDTKLLKQLGLPTDILGDICRPGTVLGSLLPELAEATGLDSTVLVITPGAHDTASAVAAVPFTPEQSASDDELAAYLSSGTWSLLGAELKQPFISETACDAPFTNEAGLEGTVRFLKNIAGLWLVQELRREYVQHGNEISFEELAEQARLADPFRTLIDPNEPQFAAPGEMAEKIRAFANQTDQPEPETIGDLIRCCLDSLALCYLDTVELLEQTLDRKVKQLHVVGGGSKNQLLNEITCGVLNRPVICGPVEATAIGNLLTQAMGAGDLAGLDEIRQVVRDSFALKTLKPSKMEAAVCLTDEVQERYAAICGRERV